MKTAAEWDDSWTARMGADIGHATIDEIRAWLARQKIEYLEAIRDEQRKACWISVRENADSIEIHGMGLNGEPYYRERSVKEKILTAGKAD